jgi:hypothetical protein
MSKQSTIYLALGGVGLGILCCAAVLVVILWQMRSSQAIVAQLPFPSPTPSLGPPLVAPPLVTASLTPIAAVGGHASPLSPTEEELLQAILPQRDQRLLAMRLKHHGQEIPLIVHETAREFEIGATDTFWVTDNMAQPPGQSQVTARLAYQTAHSYWWVEEGLEVEQAALEESARRFEEETYPTNRAFFGEEWSPGVDGDVRLHIFMGNVPGVAGYFSASNEYSRLAEPYSNEREMFFINLKAMSPGYDEFDSTLAHEFQHMIHWHQDRNEGTWVNEGLSELAAMLNGYGGSSFATTFLNAPDTQLTAWADTPNSSLANYGGSFLFMAYFLQRYGEETLKAVVAHPNNGAAGFNAVLAETGRAERFDDIFADFLVANYVQAPEGRWGYEEPGISLTTLRLAEEHDTYPAERQATVTQYGGDTIELTGRGAVTVEFAGQTQVKVIDNEAHSGAYQWYSHRGDDSDTRLTRAFDLRGVNDATLTYWTWYDIEPNWDYGYVEISTDNGQSWTILPAPHSKSDNPSGNAFGPGYTGLSGGWLEERVDISAYVGQSVLIRFEYVTDDAVNHPGWTIDDIAIPEIDFVDDVEAGRGEWQAEGFVRIDNILPQRFLVQIVEVGEGVEVRRMALDEQNRGGITITGLGATLDRAALIVSGLTPVTTELAGYEYKLTGP